MRGRNNNNRNNNKGPNPLTKSYESNGPDVKIRGTAQHIAEKYSQLARDAQSSGDPVAAENYFQHAEHYYRIIAAAQEQLREQYGYQQQRSFDEEGGEDQELDEGMHRPPLGLIPAAGPAAAPAPGEEQEEGQLGLPEERPVDGGLERQSEEDHAGKQHQRQIGGAEPAHGVQPAMPAARSSYPGRR